MSSMQDLPGLAPLAPVSPPADVPARPRLRAVPDVPLDFDEAVRTLTPRLVRYATRRLGDVHEAEEVVQEALLRAYKHREELLTEDDLAAWSTCVTGRLVIDRLRVRGRSTSVAEVPEGTRVGRDTADVVVARDEARTALDALDAMPPRQAAVLWAREVEGLAYDEIGARFGMTEPAVRSILTRARKALRKEYAARGGTLPAGGLAAIAPWADGLGWLERLRGALGRIAAPAALGVVTTGLLAGGLLTLPSFDTVTPAPPAITTTVVTALDTPVDDAPAHGVADRPTSVAAPVGSSAVAATSRRGNGADAPNETVARTLGCTSTDGTTIWLPAIVGGGQITLPVSTPLGGELGFGGSQCNGLKDKSRLEVNSPADPLGTGITGVEVWLPVECPDPNHRSISKPTTPTSVVTCQNDPAKDNS